MVGHLVSLKLRYVLASFKQSTWVIVGISFGILYLLGAIIALGAIYIGLSAVPELHQAAINITVFIGIILSLGWTLIPILVTGLDGTLDESRFVLFPITPKDLQKGQFLSGFIGLPGLATLVLVFLGVLGYLSRPVLILLYLPCALLGLATLMALARVANLVGAYLHRNPRINTITTIILAIFLMLSGVILSTSIIYIAEHLDQTLANLAILNYTPFGAAFAIPAYAASGNWALAGVCLVLALAYFAIIWWAWGAGLARAMRNISETKTRSGKILSRGDIGIFARFPATQTGAIAARTVHSCLKDNRQIILAPMVFVLYILMGMLFPVMSNLQTSAPKNGGSGNFTFSIGGGGVDPLFNFWVYFATVVGAYYILYLVSYDHSAFSLHVLSPLRGRADRLGRLVGYSIVMVPCILVALFAIALVQGAVEYYPLLVVHQLGVYCVSAGIVLVADTYLSPPVAPPGSNPFKIPRQSDGMTKMVLNMAVMLICFVASTPALICNLVYFMTRNTALLWLGGGLQMVIGVLFVVLGVIVGGKNYDRRSAKMLQRVSRIGS